MSTEIQMLRRIQLWRPGSREEIATWVEIFLGMRMPERGGVRASSDAAGLFGAACVSGNAGGEP